MIRLRAVLNDYSFWRLLYLSNRCQRPAPEIQGIYFINLVSRRAEFPSRTKANLSTYDRVIKSPKVERLTTQPLTLCKLHFHHAFVVSGWQMETLP